MPEHLAGQLAAVHTIIEEHHSIGGSVKLIGDSVSDLEAFIALQKLSSGWSQSSIDALEERKGKLQQTLELLDEGLRKHYALEERTLPPIFGETLMEALLNEHRQITETLDASRKLVSETKFAGMVQEQLLARKAQIQQTISDLCQMVDDHAKKETIILQMVERSLHRKLLEEANHT